MKFIPISLRQHLRLVAILLVTVCLQSESLTMSPSHDLTRQEAQAIAAKILYDSRPSAEYVILTGETLERDFGWVFFYAPRQYLDTKNPNDLIPGAGPLVVLRKDGSTRYLPTSVPPVPAVDEFERRWHSGRFKGRLCPRVLGDRESHSRRMGEQET